MPRNNIEDIIMQFDRPNGSFVVDIA